MAFLINETSGKVNKGIRVQDAYVSSIAGLPIQLYANGNDGNRTISFADDGRVYYYDNNQQRDLWSANLFELNSNYAIGYCVTYNGTYTSGYSVVCRYGRLCILNYGLINVYRASQEPVISIPEGFRPGPWTSIPATVSNNGGPLQTIMFNTDANHNGDVFTGETLTNAYVNFMCVWVI